MGYVPPRTLDLLEIAAFVYGADRYSYRGDTDAVEYSSWDRVFSFHIRVRDHDFWCRDAVQEKLARALKFLTGDRSYEFCFYEGQDTSPSSLFDQPDYLPRDVSPRSVALFSGGLDSLAGATELLMHSTDPVLLVSHQSQPGTKRTQRNLVKALSTAYPERVVHYPFGCNLTGTRAREESQRSRSFLYTSVAYAVSEAFGLRRSTVFENGVTSINFARREDLINARTSRTTHPKSMGLLEAFLSEVAGTTVSIDHPYLFKTKADIVRTLLTGPHAALIPSAVSCSRTFRINGNASQCGECFQCIDRRLAAYAADA